MCRALSKALLNRGALGKGTRRGAGAAPSLPLCPLRDACEVPATMWGCRPPCSGVGHHTGVPAAMQGC